MRVTTNNNRLMAIMASVNILLIVLFFVLPFASVVPGLVIYYLLNIIRGVFDVFLSFYLVLLIQFAGEKVAVQTPFSIFLAIKLIFLFIFIFPFLHVGNLIQTTSIYIFVLIFYIAIMTTKMKNPVFSTPFKIYGASLIAVMIFGIVITFFNIKNNTPYQQLSGLWFTSLTGILPMLAILNILSKSKKVLSDKLLAHTEV